MFVCFLHYSKLRAFLVLYSVVKNLSASAGDMGWEGLLEKEMATHCSILAQKSHGQRSLVGYSPWDPKRVRQESVKQQQQTEESYYRA